MANQQQQVKGSAVHVATSHDDEQHCGGAHVPFDLRDMQTAADADLGDRFERALMRLEGLMYAVYGAIPDYHGSLQWWKGKNPRCLWPEQLSYDSPPPNGQGEDYWYHQLAAWGNYATYQGRGNFTTVSSTGYFDWGRSSTIAQQYHRTNHVADWFPPGSVSMVGLGAYDDPQPGTDLRIVWTVPEGKRNKVASVKLVLADTELTMASGDGGYTYIYTVSGGTLTHNDRRKSFYLKLVTNEAVPQTICDPYGATPPTAPTAFMPTDTWDSDHMPGDDQNTQAKGDSYWFVPFKHEAPYEHGLPELLWKNYSGDKRASLKRCTGTWQFKPWTNIKPGLINVARFCLDSLGEFFEQSPLLRGASPGCCFKHLSCPRSWYHLLC